MFFDILLKSKKDETDCWRSHMDVYMYHECMHGDKNGVYEGRRVWKNGEVNKWRDNKDN